MRAGTLPLFHVPYSGNIESIDAQGLKNLAVKEDGAVAKAYSDQLSRIANTGLDVTAIAPAQGGGLIVRCASETVEKVYDAVFGNSQSNITKQNVVNFPVQEAKTPSMLQGIFNPSAEKFRMGMDFAAASKAVASVRNDNNLEMAPALKAA